MSMFAGIVVREPGDDVPEALREELRRRVTEGTQDEPVVLDHPGACFVKMDLGLFAVEGHFRDAQTLAAIAGDAKPIPGGFPSDDGMQARGLRGLVDRWRTGSFEVGRYTRGLWAAVAFDAAAHALHLGVDRSGVRPLYYWIGDRFVVFSTTLRVVSELSAVPRKTDLRGATELAAFGYPLDRRTGYEGIEVLHGGEVLTIDREGISFTRYWRWDALDTVGEEDADALAEAAFDTFHEGVRIRLAERGPELAFLSGGLDSRCIVSILRSLQVPTYTLNFARQGTQDHYFGRLVADALGTVHHESVPNWSQAGHVGEIRQLIEQLRSDGVLSAGWRDRVWDGNGGSVDAGFVYVTPSIVEHMRAGRTDGAIREFRSTHGIELSRRLMRPAVAQEIDDWFTEGIREQIDRQQCDDPARRFFLFLVENDQRRHMADHFETVLTHRIERNLPFLDGTFLEHILRVPIDLGIGHRFYMRWFQHFPAAARSVPWQTYPDHVSCPLPVPDELSYQWDARAPKRPRPAESELTIKDILARRFPTGTMRRLPLLAGIVLTRFGLRDCSHMLRNAAVLRRLC